MRIVQTFWAAEGELLTNSYGWINPQYHLMSWALSCLSLREHYNEVVLYTDSKGYEVFIEQLKLPYTDVIIQYDNLHCPKPHWAYPKVLTYSLQKTPFIHVDGDVYLPNKLSDKVEAGEVIAQNLEIGSSYYKNMMNHILRRGLSLPDYLKQELLKESITSYNAGVLGGNDLEFIKEYCQTAFHIIESNRLNEMNSPHIDINNNILFEQILFYALSNRYNKSVTTVLDHSVRDNGYTSSEFCNFYRYNDIKLIHILGGHKKNQRSCELLSKTLLNKYPDYYKRIIELFSCNHNRLKGKAAYAIPHSLTMQVCMTTYQEYLHGLFAKWKHISNEDLFKQEQHSSAYLHFINASREDQDTYVISKNPYLSVFQIPEHWIPEIKDVFKERINNRFIGNFDIACIPCLLDNGFKEILINGLCCNILTTLSGETTFKNFYKEILSHFSMDIKREQDKLWRLIMNELEYLFYNGLIYIKLF